LPKYSPCTERKYERASYRNIAEVLWAETGEAGIVEFIRRLVFNALIGNADMHLKNWSLIYPDRLVSVLNQGLSAGMANTLYNHMLIASLIERTFSAATP
jgi:serine/threonine-protein kinase HipA